MAESDNVLTKLHDLLVYLVPQLNRFPREQKFVLGDRIEVKLLEVQESCLRAYYGREKRPHLIEANLGLEVTRHLIRLAHALRRLRCFAMVCCLAGSVSRLAGQIESPDFVLNTIGESPGIYADSADFTLNATDVAPGVYAGSGDFTLNTTDALIGVGGPAQGDSPDFTLNTIGESPGIYADTADFTLNTTGESPRVSADSGDFTLNTTGESPMYPGPATLVEWVNQLGNQFQFSVSGSFGVAYAIQANTNLNTRNWVSLFTNTAPFTFTDLNAGDYKRRFYRALYLP